MKNEMSARFTQRSRRDTSGASASTKASSSTVRIVSRITRALQKSGNNVNSSDSLAGEFFGLLVDNLRDDSVTSVQHLIPTRQPPSQVSLPG